MIRVTADIGVSSEYEARQLLDALQMLMISTRRHRGCLGCTARIERERRTVVYQEQWESEEELRERVASDDFTSILALLEKAAVPPSLQFDFVTETRGLDYVARVRGVQTSSG